MFNPYASLMMLGGHGGMWGGQPPIAHPGFPMPQPGGPPMWGGQPPMGGPFPVQPHPGGPMPPIQFGGGGIGMPGGFPPARGGPMPGGGIDLQQLLGNAGGNSFMRRGFGY